MKQILFLLLFTSNIYAQQYGFSGFVSDSLNAERLANVFIQVNDNQWGGYSNRYGYFFIKSDAPITLLTFSHIGYSKKIVNLADLSQADSILVVKIAPEIITTETVSIERRRFPKRSGRAIIPISEIKQVPSIGGEADPIKAAHLFPGVLKSFEGGASFHVRGGDFDQNLILLDGIQVYNINHFFGFLSVFNVDAIKQMEFIRAGFKPAYGGKLSSVIDLSMKEGNQNQFEYKGGVSLLSSRFLVEGPLAARSSMMVSARRTYIDPALKLFSRKKGQPNAGDLSKYYFYDLNAKVKIGLSELSKIYFSAYLGADNLAVSGNTGVPGETSEIGLGWGNQTYLLRWNYLLTRGLFANLSAGYTNYKADMDLGDVSLPVLIRQPGIADYILNLTLDAYLSDNLFLNSGYQIKKHQIDVSEREETAHSTENILFTELEFNAAALKIDAGLRYLHLQEISYNDINPRVNINYNITEKIGLSASYDRMTQPVHKLSFNNIFNPGDLYFPSGEQLKPQKSAQYSGGLTFQLQGESFSFSSTLSPYYKKMKNLPLFIYHINEINTETILENLTIGTGTAKGIELESDFTFSLLRLMLNYGYLDSWRTYPNKNKGRPFQPKFDRSHYLNLFAQYPFSKKLSFAATLNVSSGPIINYPEQRYKIFGLYPSEGDNDYFEYGQLNHLRAEPQMRVDVSMTYKYSAHWELFLSVYNLFANNYPIFYEAEIFSNTSKFTGTSLGFLPTFGFNFSY